MEFWFKHPPALVRRLLARRNLLFALKQTPDCTDSLWEAPRRVQKPHFKQFGIRDLQGTALQLLGMATRADLWFLPKTLRFGKGRP